MPEIRTADGKYLLADQSDGNVVVYDLARDVPVWDKWNYEAAQRADVDGGQGGGGAGPPHIDPPHHPLPSTSPRVIRLTNDADWGVRPVGMSYWPNINNHAGRDDLRVLVSLADALTLMIVDKASLTVVRRIALPFMATGESCYWSFTDPDVLYVVQPQGLLRYHVVSGATETVVDVPGSHQFHSSADGQVHSFSLDGDIAAVMDHGTLRKFNGHGPLDEVQVDKFGRWLLIKETDDNRLVDLQTGREWMILNREGAAGHSDMGYGYMVGEDDYADAGGAFRLWTFTDNGPVKGPIVHTMGTWEPMTRYVSHCNAQPGSPEGQRLLFSSSELGLVARTIGANDPVQIAPSLTDLAATGGGDPYWRKIRANIDPLGEYACWSGNHGTARMDVYLAVVP